MKPPELFSWSKGVVITASAGNAGIQGLLYPAAANHVVGVGATNGDDNWASSNTDDSDPNTPVALDVMAPGVSLSTTGISGGYGFFSGTSASSPEVAGLAALILSANPSLTSDQVTDIITSTASDLGTSGWDPTFGYGRIRADLAVQKAVGATPQPTPSLTPTVTPLPTPTPSDTQPPTVSVTSPSSGATISGISTLAASASDNVSVSSVSFFVDNVFLGESVSNPYAISWDTTQYSNGSHSIQAKAIDAAGNLGQSTIISVSINNPISTPTPTSTPISTSITISNITVSATATSATIRWTTNVPTSSFVKYGKSSTSLNLTSNTTTNNTVTLTGLSAKTTYYYQIISTSSNNLSSTSSVQSFRTKPK